MDYINSNVYIPTGSPIPGCNSSEITTPSFCFPGLLICYFHVMCLQIANMTTKNNNLFFSGSNDKRCPQLPGTFSTRQPSTYLPPFLDSESNRVKRSSPLVEKSEYETVKFQMSFKSLNFA